MARKTITNSHVQKAYIIGKQVFKKQKTLKIAVAELVEEGMDQSSAHDYIYSYSNFIQGKLFTRTTNVYATDYYLERIYQESGKTGLENALIALSRHIDYYEQLTKGKVKKGKEVYNKYLELLGYDINPITYPDDVLEDEIHIEGASKKILVNTFERNPVARQKCIDHYGAICIVCDFDFEKKFGVIGKDFIHVHHLLELNTIRKEYIVNPITDLIPVCPNCHAMLHKKKIAYTINELKKIINDTAGNSYYNGFGH